MTTRTNAAYAELAYRKSILGHFINLAMRDYVGEDGQPPKEAIICEDVFREDSEIPPERVLEFVEDWQAERAEIQLELNKFEFKRNDGESSTKRPQKKKSTGRRRQARSKAPS